MSRWNRIVIGAFALALLGGTPAGAQDHGSGMGDMFGDLVHVKRNPITGQPILQRRMIEYPQDVIDWGYCPIFVDQYGLEVPFAPLSCDVDPAQIDRLVEVDYFGRLSGGRTKERNLRMHFDETINSIKAAEVVDREPAGRLRLGTECTPDGACASWRVIDSPFENLAFYHRLLKYGHIQTDPAEVDTSSGGDPAAGTVYHPALGPADWAKFSPALRSLLPRSAVSDCFSGDTFIPACAQPTALTGEDFIRVASLLAGAADKTGKITIDLVQYMNRILRITVATPESAATLVTLPALIRDENGVIAPAPDGLPAPADERFVDFSPASYLRVEQFSQTIPALVAEGEGLWRVDPAVSFLPFLRFINGDMSERTTGMSGFIANASDALRAVEFIHNYEPPEDIGAVGARTTTTVGAVTVPYSATTRNVTLQATVVNSAPVNSGTVTFTVQTGEGVVIGSPAISGTVAAGVATASYALPGGTSVGTLVVIGAFNGGTGFAPSYGIGSLTIGVTETVTTVAPASAPLSDADQPVALSATVSTAASSAIDEGSITFTVRNGGGSVVGIPLVATVVNNVGSGVYTLPGGLTAQTLTITAEYGGGTNFLGSTGSAALVVGCPSVIISPVNVAYAAVGLPYSQVFTFSGTPPVTSTFVGTLPAGLSFAANTLSGTPTTEGEFTFSISAIDAMGCTGIREYELYVGSPRPLLTGSGPGRVAQVRSFLQDGTIAGGLLSDLIAYDPSYGGGVRVAAGDVNGDGVTDLMTGPATLSALVKVVSGATGQVMRSFNAFPDPPVQGVYVSLADVDGDGYADFIVGRGNGASQVRVLNGRTAAVIREFTAFPSSAASGVSVAGADVNADGYADVVTGAGPGGPPQVTVFDGATGTVLTTFLAYAEAFAGGVFVAAGDVNGDGFADIVTGAGAGGGPHVRVWDGRSGAEILGFFAYDPAFAGGVRVAAADLDRDGRAEIATGAGPGGSPHVRLFDGVAGLEVGGFLAYEPSFTGGVYVANQAPIGRMSVDAPKPNASVPSAEFAIGGWAFHEGAASGTGVDAIHVWAIPTGGGAPIFVGAAALGGLRPDVAAVFGDRWEASGFNLAGTLPPGVYDLIVFVHSDVSGTFNNRRVVRITVQ